MLTVVICDRFGWTWHEYQDQPQLFLNEITAMLRAESKARIAADKKAARGI